jgi:hypothetical protein
MGKVSRSVPAQTKLCPQSYWACGKWELCTQAPSVPCMSLLSSFLLSQETHPTFPLWSARCRSSRAQAKSSWELLTTSCCSGQQPGDTGAVPRHCLSTCMVHTSFSQSSVVEAALGSGKNSFFQEPGASSLIKLFLDRHLLPCVLEEGDSVTSQSHCISGSPASDSSLTSPLSLGIQCVSY